MALRCHDSGRTPGRNPANAEDRVTRMSPQRRAQTEMSMRKTRASRGIQESREGAASRSWGLRTSGSFVPG